MVVNGANMQRSVPGSIVAVHVGAVEQQVLQVLDETVATGLLDGWADWGCWIYVAEFRFGESNQERDTIIRDLNGIWE